MMGNQLQGQIDPMALYQAMSAFDGARDKYDLSSSMALGNYGAAGGLGVIGNIMGALLAKKDKQDMMQSQQDYLKKTFEWNQQQAAIAAQQKAAEEERKRALLLEDEKRERGYAVEDRDAKLALEHEQLAAQNQRHLDTLGLGQQRLELDRQAQAAKNSPQSMFNNEEIGLIKSGAVTPEQLIEVKKNEALGVKPEKELSGEMRVKLAQIQNARKKLAEYEKQAFVNGDYQEFGSKFGNTNDLFKEAIESKLRAESGAAISDAEREGQFDIYQPGMFKSDKTNMDRVKQLREALEEMEKSILSGKAIEPIQVQEPTQQTVFKPTQQQNKLKFKYSNQL